MSIAVSTSRLQILVDQKDRQLGENITQSLYGLSLPQVLRLVIKKIIQGEFIIGLIAKKTEKISPPVEKEIIRSLKSGIVTLADKKPLTHYSVDDAMAYLESDEASS